MADRETDNPKPRPDKGRGPLADDPEGEVSETLGKLDALRATKAETMAHYWDLAEKAEAWAEREAQKTGQRRPGHRTIAAKFGVDPSRMRAALQVLRAFKHNDFGRDKLLGLELAPGTGRRPGRADRPTFWMIAALCLPRWRDRLPELLAKAMAEGWSESEARAYLATRTPSPREGERPSPTGVAKTPGRGTRQRGERLIARLRAATRRIDGDIAAAVKAGTPPAILEALFAALEVQVAAIERLASIGGDARPDTAPDVAPDPPAR